MYDLPSASLDIRLLFSVLIQTWNWALICFEYSKLFHFPAELLTIYFFFYFFFNKAGMKLALGM